MNPVEEMLKDATEQRNAGNCPVCGHSIQGFKDKLSQREFEISGLCQRCQDEIFEEKL